MTKSIYHGRRYLAAATALALVAWLAPVTTAAEQAAWSPDEAHTEINFSVKHFFTPVSGSFEDYEIDLHYDPENPENSSVEARIEVASVYTGNERRDNHLRAADWFDAAKYPYMTFKSTSVRRAGEDGLIATGRLTIKGESREIELPITLLGQQTIPESMRETLGGTKKVASFEASTTIERGDFGVGAGSWAGTMVVGGKVKIQILLEAHKK